MRRVVAILGALITAAVVVHPESLSAAPTRRPKVGLVLGGGGALGLAHIGVLRVLEENRVPVDYVAGTSMGALVGGLYASGKDSREIEGILKDLNWDELFSDQPKRKDIAFRRKLDDRGFMGTAKLSFQDGNIVVPSGAIYGQNIDLLFAKLYRDGALADSFDRLPIPYRAIGADVETGREVVLERGSLARAARASMSVPGVFAPVEIDGKLLVDGGIANNLPVDVVKAMGADIIIAVNLPADFQKRDELKSALAVARQVLSFLLDQNARLQIKQLGAGDILIEPVLKGYTPTDFEKSGELLKIGLDAARTRSSLLAKLSVPEKEYLKWRESLRSAAVEPIIQFVRIVNSTAQSDEAIIHALGLEVGQKFDETALQGKIKELYDQDVYSQLRYELRTEGGRTGVLISAEEKTWLKQYLRLGFSLSDNFEGESGFVFGGNYRWTGLNSRGAEAEVDARIGQVQRLGLEFYQPFHADSPYFLSAGAQAQEEYFRVFSEGEAVAKYRRDLDDGTLALGRVFGSSSEVRFGFTRGGGKFRKTIGDSSLPQIEFETGTLFARYSYDTFDNPSFPHDGSRLDLRFNDSVNDLGGSKNYQTIQGAASRAYTLGETYLIPNISFSRALSDLPLYASFSNGGLFNVSGFQRGELINEGTVLGRLIAYHTVLGSNSGLLTSPVYVGGSVEVGQFWNADRPDQLLTGGSVFLGADTPILPVYLGFGLAQGGRAAGYLSLDRPF